MTSDELRQALDAAGVEYPDDARKPVLQALYDDNAPTVVVQGRPAHMTRLQAREWSQR